MNMDCIFVTLSRFLFLWTLAMHRILAYLPYYGPTKTEADVPHAPAPTATYDYVVIGGGAAGCGLAATLAKTGRTLLLERGKTVQEVPETQERASWPHVMSAAVEWTQTESGSWAASANVLGGGTSVNAGVFLKETRDSEFFKQHPFLDWEEVGRAYSDVSRKVAHERRELSSNGFSNCMFEAMREVGLGESAVSTETTRTGIIYPRTIFNDEGRRCSSVDLLPSSNDPAFHNLIIKTNVRVTRLLFDTQASRPRAIGIEFQKANDIESEVNKLILPQADFYLCGGALHTPHLLMLSGVGDANNLKTHQIKLVLDNPHIGRHLMDHPMIPVSVSSLLPIEHTIVDIMAVTKDFHIESVSGGSITTEFLPLTLPFVSSQDRLPYKRNLLRLVLKHLSAWLLKLLNQQFCFILLLNNPVSEGWVNLSSADPHERIRIRSPGLEDPEEWKAMKEGLLVIRKLVDATALRKYRRDCVNSRSSDFMRAINRILYRNSSYIDNKLGHDSPVTFPVLPDLDSLSLLKVPSCNAEHGVDGNLISWLSEMYMDGWHYTSTCRFGDVVNPDFTVKGIDGLRIVDASVLMRPPRVNMQATIMMLGIYAGRMITSKHAACSI